MDGVEVWHGFLREARSSDEAGGRVLFRTESGRKAGSLLARQPPILGREVPRPAAATGQCFYSGFGSLTATEAVNTATWGQIDIS